MFEFYYSILKKIAICSHFLIAFSSKCDLLELEPNELLISLINDVRFIETNSDSLEQLNQIPIVLTQQAFNISYLESEKIISTIISDQTFYDSTQQQWMCKLVKQQSYNILCNYIKLYPIKNDEVNMEIQFKVDIITEQQDYCDEFFQWQISYFLILCNSKNSIKLYSVDMSNNTVLIAEKEIHQYQFENCKREYIKQSESWFFVFYDCLYWAIFQFSGSSFELLIDQNINFNKTNQSIPQVERVQICKYLNKEIQELYLITEIGYYQYRINKRNKELFWVSFEKYSNVKQLIFTNQCLVHYLIIKKNQSTIIMINIPNKELVNFESNIIQVHKSSNLLFVLSNEGLDVILNQKIRQHLQIQANRLFFLDRDKYFYYIDENYSQISFYNYNDLNQFLIPTQKYVYKVFLKDYFEINLLNCYKVEIKDNIEKTIIFNDIYVVNQCEKSDTILFDKQNVVLPLKYDIQVSQESIAGILSITEIVDFQQSCNIKFISKDSFLLYWDDNYALFKNNLYMTIQECINNVNQKIPILSHSVFQYELNFLVIKIDEQQFKIMQKNSKFVGYQISTQYKIEKFIQFQNYVIIIAEKAQNIIIVKINSFGQEILSKGLISMLFQIYNREESNTDAIFFYSRQYQYTYIQFLSNFIIFDEYNDQINSLPLKNIQILSLKKLIQNTDQIIAVHLKEDVIFQYIITNQQHLTVQYNYTLINAKFIKPLKFQIENHKSQNAEQSLLFILVQQNQENYIYIFRMIQEKPLKLVRIINVSIPEFFIVKKILHYYDENLDFKAIDIFSIHIKLNNQELIQRDAFQSDNLTFQIVSKNTTENVIKCIFRLNQYNLCNHILKVHNQIEIMLNNKLKQQIQINEFFVGPLENVYISNDSMVKLNGFYQQQVPVNYCQQSNENNCIISINVSNKLLTNLNKKFIVHIFKQKQQNTFFSLIDELTQQIQIYSSQIDVFLINEWQLVIIRQLKNQIAIIIQDIDKDTFEIKSEQQHLLEINSENFNFQISLTGTIIQIKSKKEEIFFFTRNLLIKQQTIYNFKEGLLFVEDSNQLYIELQSENLNIQINILELDDTNLKLIHFVKLNQTIITNHLQNILDQYFTQFQKFIQNHLLESIQKRNQINLVVLQEYEFFSIILNISLELNNTSVKLEIEQILRNPESFKNLKQIFYKSNILILTSDREQRYLYDFKQQKQFHYYQYTENSTSKLISSFNSTHFIFQNLNQNYSIGQLYYEIELLEGHQNQETCILVAENSISKADIKLIIATQREGQMQTIILIIISSILVIAFIICKVLIKIIKERKTIHQIQIELQNSNVQNFDQ